jgi:ribosomal protein L7/L12
MYDESTGISSGASFRKLREECSELVKRHPDITSYHWPNIHILACEHNKQVENMSCEDIVNFYGKTAKLSAIKLIREKFPVLGLAEAKYIVDGYFKRHGWE